MAAFKKLFHGDRSSSRPPTSPGFAADEPYFGSVQAPTPDNLEAPQLSPGLPSPGFPSPGLHTSRAMDVAHHFEQIEKQFEDLHQHLATRPLSATSQLSPSLQDRFPAPKKSSSRHIDLLDALFSSEKRPETSAQTISPPASPYNEDVAERNMTRFLRVQNRNGYTSSRILSALYQEDVADRNIAKYSGPDRSLSALSCRSSPAAPGRVRNLSPDAQRRDPRKRSAGMPNWTSDGDLRNRSTSAHDSLAASQANAYLRQQRSEPSFSPDDDYGAAQEEAIPAPIQRLGVPPAFKQGRRWSNTPLPDSPTLPVPLADGGNDGTEGDTKSANSPTSLPPPIMTRSSSLTPRSLSPPPSAGSVGSTSRKNVRDLSINVQLASSGRPKIAHRAIQPPTPSTYEMKRAPSIAEVMNSPLPAPSPAQPSPRFKASEMMDLFNKAYMSTRAVSPHPTYESLQDAIVREINSHEAFQRVPPPAGGPPFTPSPVRDTFEAAKSEQAGLNRSASAGQFSKIMRKSSFKKHKRNSESRRSISTSVPSKGYDRILRRVSADPSRRRHTDAPPPTPGFLANIDQDNGAPQRGTGEQLTYMDVLYHSGNNLASAPAPRERGNSESATNVSAMARATPDIPNTPGAVYCMQAHSTPSRDSRSSLSHEDSDDDIIHLPSVGAPPPRVQIEGVDENNVRYVIDTDTATHAQKLMSWPQRVRRANPPQPTSAPTSAPAEHSLSPLSRARMQLRGARSVETY